MYAGHEEISIHVAPVDVDASVKENSSSEEITSDSGVDSSDSGSTAPLKPSSPQASPIELLENDLEMNIQDSKNTHERESSPALITSSSISLDINDATKNLVSFDEDSEIKYIDVINKNSHIIATGDDSNFDNLLNENVDNYNIHHTENAAPNSTEDLQGDQTLDMEMDKPILDFKYLDSVMDSSKHLAISTVSLDNEKSAETLNINLSKSQFSRSAENVSNVDPKLSYNMNSSTKDLNTETILTQFTNQKMKASAVQKIPTTELQTQKQSNHQHLKASESTQTNIDVRYPRLPKELLSQDLGSIVKNVHGIFSSVSGSLKSAYTHRSSINKTPVRNVTKPIQNGNIMDEIFEENNEKIAVQINQKYDSEVSDETKTISDSENSETEIDAKRDFLRLQMESLERVLAEQRKENGTLRERVKQLMDELQERDQMFKEMEAKVDLMTRRLEQADREKDAAVMRYASVECASIEARRAAERAAAAERSALGEVDLLNNKLKSAHAEKQRICQLYDDKCHEVQTHERELGRTREELKELEGRLKWTQSKLRMEMDAYKESAERAEKLSQQVSELEAAKEAAATNNVDTARAKQQELELKESQAALILCRHEREDMERRLASCTAQLETYKRERDSANSDLAAAVAEVEHLKQHNLRLEEEAAELAALRAQAALADTLSAQLQRESERAAQAEEALSVERARAETCARREARALEHAAHLTAQHVQQRASSTDIEHKAQALSVDNASLRERISTLECECARLHAALTEESDRRNKENRVLARKVAELTEEVSEANKKLEWEKGENCVMKKKHASAIKELNRELQRSLKRCEQLEAKLPPPEHDPHRTGSVSSLSSSGETAQPEDRLQLNGHNDATMPDVQVVEPDRQTLIERIVSLQRAAARRSERCEFLEEHARQLTSELRAKSRLLRQLLCSMPAGAVASQNSDAHKKEIARLGGGAMAAVWGGDPAGMTLELSLEMNKRLQAVLEDALLKNITLKENMDTLGEEIARLKDKKLNNETK